MSGPWNDFQARQPKAEGPWTDFGPKPLVASRDPDLIDAIVAGMQNSATGLAVRGKLPEQQLDPEAPWYHRAAAGAAGVVTDLPLSVVGAIAGSAAGSAVPVVGTAIGGGAGAFAAPMALREALVEAYSNNHALDWNGVWQIAKAALKGGIKGAVLGGATLGAGRFVGGAVAGTVAARAAPAAAFGAELATLTTTAAALEGHMPTWQDFMDNAILLGGLKGAVHIAKGLQAVYAQTGKLPHEVVADAQRDPKIAAELKGELPPVPEGYVRLYRGQMGEFPPSSNTRDAGRWFTTDKAAAEFYGEVRYVDVPAAVAKAAFEEAQAGGTILNKTGHLLPAEWANQARGSNDLPQAYRQLALEERIKASIDADARPETIRQNMMADPAVPETLGRSKADPVRYEYISDLPTAQGVIREVAKLYDAEIAKQTRGEVSNKASAIEGMRALTRGEIGPHVIGEAASAGEIWARAHLLKGAVNHALGEMNKLAQIPEAELSPAMKLNALASLERVSMLQAEFAGARAEAGRALQIHRRIKYDPAFLGDAKTILKLAERKMPMQDLARKVQAFKDPAQLADFIKRYDRATTTEMVLEGWKAAILSGPLTHIANLMGNTMKWFVDIPESVIATSLHALNQAVKGDPLTLAQWKARAFAPLYGVQLGARDALTVAGEVLRGRGEHLEKADVYRTAIPGKAGEVIRTPFKLLHASDVLFRTPAERARAHVLAVDRVVKEGIHPSTAEGRQLIAQYTQVPEFGLSAKAAAEVIAKIEHAGAEAVYAQRLGPRLEIAQRALAGSWAGFVVPFIRTPANLVSWAVQHTPGLNFLSARWRSDFAAGGEARAQAVARVVVGAGLMLTAQALSREGMLTGAGMFAPEERRTKTAAGWQPYSFKIGDKYYSYQRLEPIAKVLGIVADMIELAENTKEDTDKAKIATMIVLMFGNATISTTYLSGLSSFINGLTDPARYGEAIVEQYASSLVPKLIGQTAAIIDPHKREVDGVADAIQAQIPYFREQLLPKRDVWGEKQPNERLFSVLPVATSVASQDKVKNEAVRLHFAMSDAPSFVLERAPFAPKDKRLELTDEQRDVFREVSGKNAMSILAPIVNSPDWETIPDFAKVLMFKRVVELSRKQAMFKALPPDAPERMELRDKLIERVLKEAQAVHPR